MKSVVGLGLLLVAVGASGVAVADPPVREAATARAPAPTDKSPAAAKPVKPLDLRVGDVRKYMMPRDFQAVVRAPEPDANTVVVEGQRDLAPMKMVEDVPMGLASLWYAAKDPKNAWRLLAPSVTFKDGPTTDKVPPPVFRWGP